MFSYLQEGDRLFMLGSQCVGMFADVCLSECNDILCETAKRMSFTLLTR